MKHIAKTHAPSAGVVYREDRIINGIVIGALLLSSVTQEVTLIDDAVSYKIPTRYGEHQKRDDTGFSEDILPALFDTEGSIEVSCHGEKNPAVTEVVREHAKSRAGCKVHHVFRIPPGTQALKHSVEDHE